MTKEEAITKYIVPAINRTWNEKKCKKILEALEQEPKTGHWITTRTFMHDGEYYCDKCKCDSPKNEKWNFCPNCGAKMIEPQESEGKHISGKEKTVK